MASATTATADPGNADHPPRYRGRFAPSPTGLLHLGSLFAAVASFLRAREQCGEWLVRIEDIDPPREIAGASDAILRQLEQAALHWDGPVLRQSEHRERYRDTAARLQQQGSAYRCSCSRRQIASHPDSGPNGTRYPGTCRDRPPPAAARAALRVRSPAAAVIIDDALQGTASVDIDATTGDVVIWRKEDLPAYHLAVVADDAWQGITEVVRGLDLFSATAPHIHLQHLLALPVPGYAHLPVLVNAQGEKLSKQTHAAPVVAQEMSAAIGRCLSLLGWPVPGEMAGARPSELLSAAHGQIDWTKLHGRTQLTQP
ncbi:MAG: tRNA glutamyl-Q(34) synthetase GluQRS [Gammaproteobacteria bacterium]|nr:tRNA glutamyl-Q(34) synthetase GluQRS [Gammaproteobacteria bacterium]